MNDRETSGHFVVLVDTPTLLAKSSEQSRQQAELNRRKQNQHHMKKIHLRMQHHVVTQQKTRPHNSDLKSHYYKEMSMIGLSEALFNLDHWNGTIFNGQICIDPPFFQIIEQSCECVRETNNTGRKYQARGWVRRIIQGLHQALNKYCPPPSGAQNPFIDTLLILLMKFHRWFHQSYTKHNNTLEASRKTISANPSCTRTHSRIGRIPMPNHSYMHP